jgi:tetratricopeptide (TPR) repeat protein
MYNLLLALAAAAVVYVLASWWTGWIAGFLPAILVLGLSYFLLARRSGRQLQAIVDRAAKELQGGRVEQGRKIFEEGFALGRWQFLIAGQIHAQLGALDYIQESQQAVLRKTPNFKSARQHLEKTWSRNWQAQAMLATIDHREGNNAAALERLEKLQGAGAKEALYWGLFAYIANKAGDADKALQVLDLGQQQLPSSDSLKNMANQVRNKKDVKMKPFAPGWYQFFPDQIPQESMMRTQRPGYTYPQPRR